MLLVHTSSRLPGIDEWHLDPPQIGPSSANGTPLHCIGETVTSSAIHQVSKHNVCLLAIQNLNVAAIMGMDTLQTFGSFAIDWVHQTLTLGGAKLI